MSLRRADIRFALPRSARCAVVLGGLSEWEEGLRHGGVDVVVAGRPVELAVAPAALAAEAIATGAPLIVLEGTRRSRVLGDAGYAQLALLPVPNRARPELLLPLGQRNAIRYAIRHWRPGTTALERGRSLVARELLGRGVAPLGRAPTTVAAREPGSPFLATAAAEAIGVADLNWFAAFSTWAHPLARGVLFLFEPAAVVPGWVVKFTRIGGLEYLFDWDEAGLRLAEQTGGVVGAAAPRLLGRLDLGGGLHASVETAATGERLAPLLRAGTTRAKRLAVVDRVVKWIVAVARQTAAPPEALQPELERLEAEVVPRWGTRGLPADLVAGLLPMAAVLQHGDLWADNIFVRDDDLTVVDWESARLHGAPLWDLLYFLTGALALIDGAETDAERLEHFGRLWRGELESSAPFFRWTRDAIQATDVPPDAVGPLATLLWLSYALLDSAHVERVDNVEGIRQGTAPLTWQMSEQWLGDPALGPSWSAWRGP